MTTMIQRKSGIERVVLLAVLGLVVSSLCGEAAVGPWQRNDQGRVRLVSPRAVAERGAPLPLGIEFHTAPDWHVYWIDAGDAGYAPKATGVEPPDLREVELRFPAPRRYKLPGDLEAIGYDGKVIYPLSEHTVRERGDVLRVAVEIDYLTCADECLPHRYTLDLEVPQADISVDDPEIQADFAAWESKLPLDLGGISGVTVRESRRLDESASEGRQLVVELLGVRGGTESDLFFLPQDEVEIERPIVRTTPRGIRYELAYAPKRVDRELPDPLMLSWVATELSLDASADGRRVALSGRTPFSSKAVAAPPELPRNQAPLWALVAIVSTAAALGVWGWFVPARLNPRPLPLGRALFGFATLGLTIEALRRLALEVPSVAIAGLELGLLTAALALWWWGRSQRAWTRFAFAGLALAAAAAGVAAVW